ncbi:MAG: hypothetical protein D6721_08380 [Gammaproteobacteria bacterium]|nr:MAG: hypothetical protein D6721_08380 [Gammaproteobacteria bacterium]
MNGESDHEAQGSPFAIDRLVGEARRLAAEYRRATGKPLPGISGEIAGYDAARLLDLELVRDPSVAWDAVGRGRRAGRRIQIKSRVIFDERRSDHRIGQVKADREWDSLMLVLMDENYEPVEIYECPRERVLEAIEETRGSGRSRRGAMSVARFRHIAWLAWRRGLGVVDEEWE